MPRYEPGTWQSGVDISDADALVGDVKDPKTFYSVAAPRKTGTMPTVAIVAANDNYPEGYHAGNVGGLDAIDTDLATPNIKAGVTIFGKVGDPNVVDTSPGDAIAGNIQSGKKAFVDGAQVTGTMGSIVTPSLKNSNDTMRQTPTSSYTKVKEVKLNENLANVKIKFSLRTWSTGGFLAYGQIYKNGVAIGLERGNSTTSWQEFEEDFAGFVANDLIQIYAKQGAGGDYAQVQNMRLYYAADPAAISVTNQDP